MHKPLILISLSALLFACSQTPVQDTKPNPQASSSVQNHAAQNASSAKPKNNDDEVKISYEENNIVFDGIKKFHKSPNKKTGNPKNIYFIKSRLNKTTGTIEHQLYLTDVYDAAEGWKSWTSAKDAANKPLEVTHLSQSEDCTQICSHIENIAIKLPALVLEQGRSRGLPITLIAKNGEEKKIIVVPSQISVQLGSIAIISGLNPKIKNTLFKH